MTHSRIAVAALGLLGVAVAVAGVGACSSKDSPPGGFEFDAGQFDTAPRDTTPFDSGTHADSTSPGEGGADGGATDGGGKDGGGVDGARDGGDTGSLGIDTAPVDGGPTPLCPTSFVDGVGTPVTYTHGDDELLAAITWDELTIAWTTHDAGTIAVHYSDRAGHDDAFATDFVLPTSLGPFPDDKVTLSADGLTMLYMSGDHQTVHQITRASRGVVFDPSTVTSAPFSRITGTSTEGGGGAKKLADLVLSKDGKWLFYTDLDRTVGPTIMLSIQLSDGTWDYPNPLDGTRLEIDSGFRRRPTGISSDKRTLFYFDEASGAPFVAFRVWDTALFNKIYGYSPTGRRAMPTDTCSRVYLSILVSPPKPDAGPEGGADVVVGPSKYAIFHAP